jgi:hypothetical protein
MNSSSQVLSVFAQERISKVVPLIIRKLQGFKITLSGEDSGLENTWDEICVQIVSTRATASIFKLFFY